MTKELATLLSDHSDGIASCIRVQIGPAKSERPQSIVKVGPERDAGRDVEADDGLRVEAVEVLDQSPQRVAVRSDQHRATGPQIGHDRRFPVRQHSGDHVGQALGPGYLDSGVPRVTVLAELAARLYHRSVDVVGAAPPGELILAVLVAALGFVLA